MPFDQGAFAKDVVDTHRKHFGDPAVDAVSQGDDLVQRLLTDPMSLSEAECHEAMTAMLSGLLGGDE